MGCCTQDAKWVHKDSMTFIRLESASGSYVLRWQAVNLHESDPPCFQRFLRPLSVLDTSYAYEC